MKYDDCFEFRINRRKESNTYETTIDDVVDDDDDYDDDDDRDNDDDVSYMEKAKKSLCCTFTCLCV